MIVLNSKYFSESEKEKTGEELLRNLYLFNSQEKTDLGELLIICEPNAGRFEFHAIDDSLLRSFMDLGYNLIIWNYSGYGEDDNFNTTLFV